MSQEAEVVLPVVVFVPAKFERGSLGEGFPGGSVVKNLPVMQETRVWHLDLEDPLQKGMATQSSNFVWRIPWREEPDGLQFMGSQSWTQLSN